MYVCNLTLSEFNSTQMIEGIKAVHACGIIHRDLKPANIMRKKNGHCVIVDFGLSENTTSDVGTVSTAGQFKGTKLYGAPELLAGAQHATFGSDIFSLGIIFYESVTGYVPFCADSDADVGSTGRSAASTIQTLSETDVCVYVLNVKKAAPCPLKAEEAPEPLNEFVLKCLARAEHRYSSAVDMLQAFDNAKIESLKVFDRVAEKSEANRFWLENFTEASDEMGVQVDRFKKIFSEKFSITEAAAGKMMADIDRDGNGIVEHQEFLGMFSKFENMEEVAKKYVSEAEEDAAKAAPKCPTSGHIMVINDAYTQPYKCNSCHSVCSGARWRCDQCDVDFCFDCKPKESGTEPANVYFLQRLVMNQVRFKSKGTVFGGSKDRIGTLTMQHGEIVARRFDDGQAILVYTFKVNSCQASRVAGKAYIDLTDMGQKPRTFTFKSVQDCDEFESALKATKTWILS